MSKKIYVAVTVGTSFRDNIISRLPISKENQTNFLGFRKSKLEEIKNDFSKLVEMYESLDEKIDSAETNSIKKFYSIKNKLGNFEKNDIHVFLITTAGTEEIASLLEERFKEEGFKNVEIRNSNFSMIGDINKNIKNFFETLNELRRYAEENDADFVILASGGYKILSDYSYLFSTIYKVPVYYIHESMEKLFEIPLAPLYWDYRVFVNNMIRVKINPQKFDPLDFLNKEEIKNELIYGEPLVKHTKKYKDILNNAIPIWHNLWIGDLIPETVEHSQKHSRRLLERFEMILEDEPELFEKYGFDSIEKDIFLFLLIVAAYLHDIGHTVLIFKTKNGSFKSLKHFPEVVREFHNIFSVYEISRNKDFLGLKRLENELFDALRLIVLYHRKKMNLATEMNYNDFKEKYAKKLLEKILDYPGKLYYVPLIENKVFKKLNPEVKIITLKVAALLKLLDELDVQADRVVDKYYQRVRRKRTMLEIKEIIESSKSKGLDRYKNINLENLEDFQKLIKEKYEQMYESLFYGKEIDSELSDELRILFKISQFRHFKKHSSIKYVIPKVDKDNLEIEISGCDTKICREVKDDIENQLELLKKDEKEISNVLGEIKLLPFNKIICRIKPNNSY